MTGHAVRLARAARLGRAGLALTAVSIAATIAVGAAGPSLMEPPLPGAGISLTPGISLLLGGGVWGGSPPGIFLPWTLDLRPGPYLAAGVAAAGLAAGAAGLALTLRAMRLGWTVRPRYVLLAGVIAAVAAGTTGPFGTSDFLSYAAYGRELVTGHNPYLMPPQALARLGDPVARAVQDWAGTPSVYGALATGVFGLASLIGGASARLTVFVLDMVNVLAFAGTGVLLDRLARGSGSAGARLRAAVLWTCNPLLLQVLVAGGHVDGLAAALSVSGIAVLAPVILNGAACSRPVVRALAAGVILGLGFAVKPTVLLVFAGLLVTLASARGGRPGRSGHPGHPGRATIGGVVAGFGAAAAADLAVMGRAGITQSFRASGMVSVGSPWRVVRTLLRISVTSESGADDVVRVLAVVLMMCLAAVLLRRLWSGDVFAGAPEGSAFAGAPGGGGALAGMAPFALVLAWLLAWPYVLPWYDVLGWALLALLPASGLDWLLLARTSALGLGYLPARSTGVAVPAGLRWMEPVIRSALTPAVLAGVVVILVITMRSSTRLAWPAILAGVNRRSPV